MQNSCSAEITASKMLFFTRCFTWYYHFILAYLSIIQHYLTIYLCIHYLSIHPFIQTPVYKHDDMVPFVAPCFRHLTKLGFTPKGPRPNYIWVSLIETNLHDSWWKLINSPFKSSTVSPSIYSTLYSSI